jgi:hypothetical protein
MVMGFAKADGRQAGRKIEGIEAGRMIRPTAIGARCLAGADRHRAPLVAEQRAGVKLIFLFAALQPSIAVQPTYAQRRTGVQTCTITSET